MYEMSEPLVIRGPRDVMAFLRACDVPSDEPAQIVLGLAVAEADRVAHTICGAAVRSGGLVTDVVDADQLVDLADELIVGAVVLATVEPGAPDRATLTQFVELRRECADAGVALLDWIVVAGDAWWSLRERVIGEAA